MQQAYCLECGKRKSVERFAMVDSTNEKGDTGLRDRTTGKTIEPSRVGICKVCDSEAVA